MKRFRTILVVLAVFFLMTVPVSAAMRLSTGMQNAMAGINTELLGTDGAMTTDATVQAVWTESVSVMLGGVTQTTHTAMSLTGAGYTRHAAITVKVGHLYKFSYYYYEGGGAGDAQVTLGSTAGGVDYYDSSALTTAAWTLKTFYFVPTTTSAHISLIATGAGVQYFDDVSIICMDGSIQQLLRYGQFMIYSGSQPADPDDAPTGTLLVTIKNGVNGVTFGDAVDGYLSKTVGETWTGVCVATGTAGWFRLVPQGDSGADLTTDARLDGTVATSSGELNFNSLAFTIGATQTISDFHPTVNLQ